MGKNFWNGIQIFLGILNAAIIIVFTFIFSKSGFSFPGMQQAATSHVIDYKDYVSILLTAIGVMIAILTLFLAIAAIWGYAQIKNEATRWAQKTATKSAKETAERIIPQEVARFYREMTDKESSQNDPYGSAGGEQNGNG